MWPAFEACHVVCRETAGKEPKVAADAMNGTAEGK